MKVMDNVKAHLRNEERVPFHINVDDNKVVVVPLENGMWKVICRRGRILEGVETMKNIQVEALVSGILKQNKRRYYLERDYDDNGYCVGFGYYALEPEEEKKHAATKRRGRLNAIKRLLN